MNSIQMPIRPSIRSAPNTVTMFGWRTFARENVLPLRLWECLPCPVPSAAPAASGQPRNRVAGPRRGIPAPFRIPGQPVRGWVSGPHSSGSIRQSPSGQIEYESSEVLFADGPVHFRDFREGSSARASKSRRGSDWTVAAFHRLFPIEKRALRQLPESQQRVRSDQIRHQLSRLAAARISPGKSEERTLHRQRAAWPGGRSASSSFVSPSSMRPMTASRNRWAATD